MRNALQKLEVEVERLKALCALSETLFCQSLEYVDSFRGFINPNAPFGVRCGDRTVFVAANKIDLGRKLKEQLPRYLCEAVFVRLISAALDVFLLNLYKEISSVNSDTHGKLLPSATLNEKCKGLAGAALGRKREIYNTNLGIDFKLFSNWTEIEEMQAVRNELVHRLGWVEPEASFGIVSFRIS